MLREDGLVMDDGTTARLSENHFIMTTTTVNAEGVYRHLEFCHQCLWPQMDVQLISITDSGLRLQLQDQTKKIISKIVDSEFDITNKKFPLCLVKIFQFAEVFLHGFLEFRFLEN